MPLNKESLNGLTKEQLINFITKNYKTYEENLFEVVVSFTYDKKTDSIFDFLIKGKINKNHFKNISNDLREIEGFLFLETLRRSGITNMFLSSKFLSQIGFDSKLNQKYFEKSNEWFAEIDKFEIYKTKLEKSQSIIKEKEELKKIYNIQNEISFEY
jgi:hypothetical protein